VTARIYLVLRNDVQQTGFDSMAKRVPPDPAGTPPRRRGPRQAATDEAPTDDLQVLFGRNLKTARIARGMTLNEAGEAAGMKNQAISQIEHGKTNLTLATMREHVAWRRPVALPCGSA